VTKPRDVLRVLARLGSDLGVALAPVDHDEVLEAICEAAQVAFGARACSIAVFDPDEGDLEFLAATGVAAASVVGMRLPVKRGIAGYVVASGQALAVHDVQRDPRFDRETAEATGYLPQSILAVPIETATEVAGVLEVLDWTEDRIGEVGLELAAVFARQAALALEQAELFADLGSMLFAAAGEAAKSEDPDLADALRAVAKKSEGPTGQLAEIAACFRELSGLGVAERRAALAMLEEFTDYARRKARRR
jgi:GAF domain-containing protein